MTNSCFSMFARRRSPIEIDLRDFIDRYLETRKGSRAMHLELHRTITFAGIGLLMALLAMLAVISTRLFLISRAAPAEFVPETI